MTHLNMRMNRCVSATGIQKLEGFVGKQSVLSCLKQRGFRLAQEEVRKAWNIGNGVSMGKYILCEKRRQRPYVVRELDLHLYSPEEMCYFMYHYLPVIDETFLNEELFRYIAEEFEMPKTARAMQQVIHIGKHPLDALAVFLKDVCYYSEEEYSRFQKELRNQEQIPSTQTNLKRAELFIERGQYRSAVQQYMCVLHEKTTEETDRRRYTKLYEQAGGLCMEMGSFEQAVSLFLEGWQYSGAEGLARKFCMSCFLAEKEPEKLEKNLPQHFIEACRQEYEQLCGEAREAVGKGTVPLVMTEHFQGRRKEAQQYFDEKKKHYRRMLA